MTDHQGQGAAAPGWYADPTGQAGIRWWDGGQWTAHTAPVPGAVAPHPARPRLPETTPVYTPFIWLIVFMPLLSSVAALFYRPFTTTRIDGIARVDPLSIYTPTYFAILALGLVVYALTVVFAYLDHRALTRLGVVRPFHWAWGFLSIVYPIGRSVIVHQVARPRGLAPVWALIGVMAVGFIVGGISTAFTLSQTLSNLPGVNS